MRWYCLWTVLLLFVVVLMGCVTQIEKIPSHRAYDPPEGESIMDELRREFGWQKPPPWIREEPFYTRAARSMKETVTGWFRQDEPTLMKPPDKFQSMQEFQRAQQDAIDRLQQQQAEENRLE